MKRHMVFDKGYSFVGTLYDKQDIALFKEQRNMDYFKIHTMSDQEILLKFGTIPELDERMVVNVGGLLMFPEEEIYMHASFDQMQMDLRELVRKFVQDTFPYLKLDTQERVILDEYLRTIYEIIEPPEEDEDEEYDGDSIDMDRNYKTDLLVLHTIRQFGAII